jgi:hypothetical protein
MGRMAGRVRRHCQSRNKLIKYLKHSEIDKQAWDETIAGSSHGLVYAFSWYLDIVSPGWDALTEGNYNAVFPLTKRKKAGFNYLYQPFFTQQLGLFSIQSPPDELYLKEFLDAIPCSFRLIEIQLNTANKFSSSTGFNLYQRKTHLLDLSDGYQKIHSSYSENLRRNIKKFEKSKCTVSTGGNVHEIISLFRSNRGENISTLRSTDYEIFEKLMAAANERNLLETITVKNESDDLIAGALFLKSVHSYIFIFSATSEEGKKNGSMSCIIDSFIKSRCNSNGALDFEGSMDENLSRFYKSFGSQEIVYLQIRKNNLPLLIRWLK